MYSYWLTSIHPSWSAWQDLDLNGATLWLIMVHLGSYFGHQECSCKNWTDKNGGNPGFKRLVSLFSALLDTWVTSSFDFSRFSRPSTMNSLWMRGCRWQHDFLKGINKVALSSTTITTTGYTLLTEKDASASIWYLAAMPKRVLLFPAVQARLTAVSSWSFTFW